jgi:mono/diheme cytochrome c family protein
LSIVCCLGTVCIAGEQNLIPPTYTAAQAQRGQQVYIAQCAQCHGDSLDNGQFAVPLKGPAFRQHWGGQGLDAPFAFMSANMPPTDPGGLPATTYADLLAFILNENGVAPGTVELPADTDALKAMAAPK